MPTPENTNITWAQVARGKAAAYVRGNADEARAWLTANNAPRAARLMQKAAVGASATTDSDVATMLGGWSSSMSTASVFFRLLNDQFFRRLPLYQRIGLAVSAPTAGIVLEGQAAPLSRIVIASTTLQPVKVVSMLAMTRELALSEGAETLFVRELRNALGSAVRQRAALDIARATRCDHPRIVRPDAAGRGRRCESGLVGARRRRRCVATGLASGARRCPHGVGIGS